MVILREKKEPDLHQALIFFIPTAFILQFFHCIKHAVIA